MSLTPSTWRFLGLGVAAGYIGLGSFALLTPIIAAKALGVYPTPSSTSTVGTAKSSNNESFQTSQEHDECISASMALLAARDISIGVALFAFDYQGQRHAMGTLILSGMVLCATDVFYVFRLRGWEWGALLGVGAAAWCAIGVGLVGF